MKFIHDENRISNSILSYFRANEQISMRSKSHFMTDHQHIHVDITNHVQVDMINLLTNGGKSIHLFKLYVFFAEN